MRLLYVCNVFESNRLYMDYAMNDGDVLPGRQVARVVESRNSDYSKGKVSNIYIVYT